MSSKKGRPVPLRNLLLAAGIVLLFGLSGCQKRVQPVASPTAVKPAPAVQPASPQPTAPPASPAPTLAASATALPNAAPTRATAVTPAATSAATAAPAAVAPAAVLPVRLSIPDLKLDTAVVEMGWKVVQTVNGPRSDWVIPKNEAGHHINSAALGEPGNLVLSGHNNIFGQVFRPISLAWNDDKRIKVDNYTDRSEVLNGRTLQLFDATGKQYNYTITDFYRLKDTGVPQEQRIANGRFIQPTDAAQVTLVTCWPPSSNTHRLIVIAVPAN
jgi:sortase A